MTLLPATAFCDLFLIASGDALERLSEEELFPDLWTDDPDFYMDCADMRDIELMLDQAGCLDAPL